MSVTYAAPSHIAPVRSVVCEVCAGPNVIHDVPWTRGQDTAGMCELCSNQTAALPGASPTGVTVLTAALGGATDRAAQRVYAEVIDLFGNALSAHGFTEPQAERFGWLPGELLTLVEGLVKLAHEEQRARTRAAFAAEQRAASEKHREANDGMAQAWGSLQAINRATADRMARDESWS